MKIQPLLTPDNYQENVRPLIESARSRFYMQTQYIHPSGRAGDEAHDALIAASSSQCGRIAIATRSARCHRQGP
jgi:phosphatidylserine/phosphatidylglycerophosphate/cardiolipin synthase-like enzyme